MPSDKQLAQVATDEPHRLEGFLKGLAPEDWSRPSACEGWLVSDVVAHLTGIGENFVDRVRRGMQGDSSEPPNNAPAGSITEDEFRVMLANTAVATRERLGDGLMPSYIQCNLDSDSVISNLKPQDWDALCYHAMGPEPVRTLVNMRIAETAMHSWDIRFTFDPQATISPDCLTGMIMTIPRAVRRAFRPDPNLARPVRYRFEAGEPLVIKTDIVLSAEGARVDQDAAESPDVIFRCGAETYVMVMFGRMKIGQAVALGLLNVDGPQSLVGQFAEAFVGG